jgi:DNA-binding transcriptional MocR family regulator
MTPSRRRALLDWASRNNAAVIEDDYEGEFRLKVGHSKLCKRWMWQAG